MRRAILMEPEIAGNVGFVARLIENFAIDQFFIVNPQCDIMEARDHAVHAQETLLNARIVDSLEQASNGLDLLVGTTGVTANDENLVRHSIPPRDVMKMIPEDAAVGLLFGREGNGLTNTDLDRCDIVVHIPAAPEYPVMNLSHAAAILFYECSVATNSTSARKGTISGREERHVLENLFKDATETFDWEPERKENAVRAVQHLVGSAMVTGRELSLLLGLFRELADRDGSVQHDT